MFNMAVGGFIMKVPMESLEASGSDADTLSHVETMDWTRQEKEPRLVQEVLQWT